MTETSIGSHEAVFFGGRRRTLAYYEVEPSQTSDAGRAASSTVTKAKIILEQLQRSLDIVIANRDLSAEGKAKQLAKVRADRLEDLDRLAREIEEAGTALDAHRTRLAGSALRPPVPTDMRQALIDLAIAQKVGGMDPLAVSRGIRMNSFDADTLRALAFTPGILSGLKPEQIGAVKDSLVRGENPAMFQATSEDGQALESAGKAIVKAYKLAAEGVSFEDRRKHAPKLHNHERRTAGFAPIRDDDDTPAEAPAEAEA